MDYKQINTPKPKALWRILFVVALFLILVPFISPKIEEKIEEVKDTGKTAVEESGFMVVKQVIDGDTIELITGQQVRYIGIDTPEMGSEHTDYECFAKEAFEKNQDLLSGKRVKLVAGEQDRDEYGRLLRNVYLPDGTFVNLELVKGGYADTMFFEPNMDFYDEFKELENKAKENNLGLWGQCD